MAVWLCWLRRVLVICNFGNLRIFDGLGDGRGDHWLRFCGTTSFSPGSLFNKHASKL